MGGRPISSDDWEVCFTSSLDFEAHLVRGYLEQYGVPCHVGSSRFGLEPLAFGALGQIEVLVPSLWAPVARGLIRGRLTGGVRTPERK